MIDSSQGWRVVLALLFLTALTSVSSATTARIKAPGLGGRKAHLFINHATGVTITPLGNGLANDNTIPTSLPSAPCHWPRWSSASAYPPPNASPRPTPCPAHKHPRGADKRGAAG